MILRMIPYALYTTHATQARQILINLRVVASESGGKKKRKPRTTIDEAKIAAILASARENPGLTNIELGTLHDVSESVFSKNKLLKDGLRSVRGYDRTDRRNGGKLDNLDGMQSYKR